MMAPEKQFLDRTSSEGEESDPFISSHKQISGKRVSALSTAFRIILFASVLVALTLAVASLSIVTTQRKAIKLTTCASSTDHANKSPTLPSKSVPTAAQSAFDLSGLDDEILDCGSSMEEALAKGCVYDSVMIAWTPARCYNRTLELEYRGDIRWYTTKEATHEVPWSLVETGRYRTLWSSSLFHTKHCLYMWKKTAIALDTEGSWINGALVKASHTQHCLKILDGFKVNESDPTSAEIFTGFQSCRRVNWPGLELRPEQMKDVTTLPQYLKELDDKDLSKLPEYSSGSKKEGMSGSEDSRAAIQ